MDPAATLPGNHPDSVYEDWGKRLGSQADILLLTEVEDRRRAELLAFAAGMPYVVVLRETDSDIAIASRRPLRSVNRQTITPPNSRLGSAQSNILSAVTELDGYPHQVVVSHWGVRDANDVSVGPIGDSPSRQETVNAILGLLASPPATVIAGGDLNAYSGVGPQHSPGASPAITRLRSNLVDTSPRSDYPRTSTAATSASTTSCSADRTG